MGKDDRLADDLRLPGWPGKLPEDKWIVWKFAFPVPPQFQAAGFEWGCEAGLVGPAADRGKSGVHP